jgi:hypothetical protein
MDEEDRDEYEDGAAVAERLRAKIAALSSR